MKTKLLRKVRKQYQIVYREEPYKEDFIELTVIRTNEGRIIDINHDNIRYNYKLIIPNRSFFKSKWDYLDLERITKTINDCKDEIIYDLRKHYPNLGNYNRKKKLKQQEYKVWYNED